MKHFKSILMSLIVLMTISSCTKESSLEPVSITVSENKEFNVKYANTEYSQYYDSVFTNSSYRYSCDELVIWESNGKYWGKYLKDNKWNVISKEIISYK